MACSRRCFVLAVISTGFLSIIFHILLISAMDFSLKEKNVIKEMIFSEAPIYNLNFNKNKPSSEKKYIESFFEFKGKKERIYVKDKESIEIVEKKNITKIYGNYFIYEKDERNYFDYKKDYTVGPGENCPQDFKKCGIFNNNGRILCLPTNEECPLNDFAISQIDNDINYLEYEKYEVDDFGYYFYYTNKKIDNKIITFFKLSNGFPCIDSSETSWISVFDNEVDKNPTCRKVIDGEIRDQRYIEVPGSDISLLILYNDNEISLTNADPSQISKTVNLYVRNFFDKNEDCINKYFSDIEEEEQSYKQIEKKIIILSSISAILLFILIFYSALICCFFDLNIYWFFLIIHIYGVVAHIISITSIYRQKLEYKCDDEEGFNNRINDIFNENYSNNRNFVLAMCIMSIITIIINLINTICLKRNKNRINMGLNNVALPSAQKPLPMMHGMQQPVYIQQGQVMNPTYGIPNPVYYNPQQINNQMNPIPNQIFADTNNNLPPSSATPLEKY